MSQFASILVNLNNLFIHLGDKLQVYTNICSSFRFDLQHEVHLYVKICMKEHSRNLPQQSDSTYHLIIIYAGAEIGHSDLLCLHSWLLLLLYYNS